MDEILGFYENDYNLVMLLKENPNSIHYRHKAELYNPLNSNLIAVFKERVLKKSNETQKSI